jgi:hypothetical protein
MNRPWIIVISGPPCSGKSTLAARLAGHTGWPIVCKDAWKEVLFELLGTGDDAWSRQLSQAAFRIQLAVARSRVDARTSLILEGNFNSAEHAAPIADLAGRGGRLLQVACRGHLDRERVSTPIDPARYGPLPIAATLDYDSAGDWEGYGRLLAALRRAGVPVEARPGA